MPLLTTNSIGNHFLLNDGNVIVIVRVKPMGNVGFLSAYLGSNDILYNQYGTATMVLNVHNKSIARELTVDEISKIIKETKRLAQLDQNKKKDPNPFGDDDFCIFDVI